MDTNAGNIIRPVVLDNTVLSNFALAGEAELVTELWHAKVCTTSSALEEYKAGVADGPLPPDVWDDLPIVRLTDEEADFAADLSPRLGRGERTCLAVALHRQGLLATDDLDARRAAKPYSIPRTGTVGILVLCVRKGYLSHNQANVILAEMIARGYRSPVASLDPLLDK